ncbi:hypothetical protein At1D1460_50420 (plasmid) [Agrobacterium tumefaciens]|nr:hypothetical protein At1D1460_50420 [Agrobacterium tumefaciens]
MFVLGANVDGDELGLWFESLDGVVRLLQDQMAEDAAIWRDIADRYGLVENDLSRLASPWHTDADLGRPIEVVTDMSRSRKPGFLDYQATDDAFLDLFGRLRADKIIP